MLLQDFIRALGLVSKANAGRSAGMVLYRYRGSDWKTPGQTLVSVMLLSGGTEGLPDVTFYPPAGTAVLKPRLLAVLTTYVSEKLNEVTIFLLYFLGLPVVLLVKAKFPYSSSC